MVEGQEGMFVVGEVEDPDGNIRNTHLEQVDYKDSVSKIVLLEGEGGAGERERVGQVRGRGWGR